MTESLHQRLVDSAGNGVRLGWAVGGLFSILAYVAWLWLNTPIVLIVGGGVVAGAVATAVADYQWRERASIGMRAGAFTGVTFLVFYIIQYFVTFYVSSGQSYIVSSLGIGSFLAFPVVVVDVAIGAAVGWIVFALRG